MNLSHEDYSADQSLIEVVIHRGDFDKHPGVLIYWSKLHANVQLWSKALLKLLTKDVNEDDSWTEIIMTYRRGLEVLKQISTKQKPSPWDVRSCTLKDEMKL